MIQSEISQDRKWTTEEIIDLVRQKRNGMVKLYLENDAIQQFFKSEFGVEFISNTKIEFLKRDMRELLLAPVDLAYYSALILELKEINNIHVMETPAYDQLFLDQIKSIFKKYIF